MLKASRFLVGMALVASAFLLSACAGYGGSGLLAGSSTLPEVMASMGEPAMRWSEPDGRVQLAYPRGPQGTQTFMVYLGTDGRLERIEGVLDNVHFARIQPGLDQAAVLRILGPSQPQWTAYFERRDELVWEWRICDAWNRLAFFDVLFDGSSGIVRSTDQRPDYGSFDSMQWLMGGRRAGHGGTRSCGH